MKRFANVIWAQISNLSGIDGVFSFLASFFLGFSFLNFPLLDVFFLCCSVSVTFRHGKSSLCATTT